MLILHIICLVDDLFHI
uniref:Uncharacterized protein n=1 Tax=Arundo donax TaxID=35708 RepID=A0A0A9CAS4_ARUDO